MGIKLLRVEVGSQPAKVWIGGNGQVLLLVHGAWGGAKMHWERVWEALAQRYRVIAPELPGIGDPESAGLASFDAYADWLTELLAALAVERVWLVGNSLGAAVVWQLAARLGRRCRGVVMVNGVPPIELPAALRGLARIGALAPLLRALYRKLNFSPAVLSRAFADPARAPAELVRVLADPPPAHLDLLVRVVCARVRAAPPPAAPVLLAWGDLDRLAGTSRLRKRAAAISGNRLVQFPSAGHCPQLESPTEFAEAIASFVS